MTLSTSSHLRPTLDSSPYWLGSSLLCEPSQHPVSKNGEQNNRNNTKISTSGVGTLAKIQKLPPGSSLQILPTEEPPEALDPAPLRQVGKKGLYAVTYVEIVDVVPVVLFAILGNCMLGDGSQVTMI